LIPFLCSDTQRQYLKLVALQLPQAAHVLGQFHIMIMKMMKRAVNQVRRYDVARLKRDGYEEVLRYSHWCAC
jgi:hypothetical protein